MIATPKTTSTGKTIVWFRKDLRLRDNPTLEFALANKREIVPVFIWNDEESGHWSPGAASRWWLHQALHSLALSIEKLGGRLIFEKGKPEEILPRLARENEADEVLYSRVYDPGGLATQEAVEEALDKASMRTESFNASLLNEPWEIKNSASRPFQVFTPFWRNSRNAIYKQPANYPIRNLIFTDQPTPRFTLDKLDLLPDHRWHEKLFAHWDVSEVAGQAQVAHAAREIVPSYANLRNSPGVDGTSRLSPYLAWGLISPRQVCQAVLKNEPDGTNRGENKFLTEIGWREFSYHLLYHFPHISDQPLRPKYADFPWRSDSKALHDWKFGKTGYPMVDAGMRQLYETGWMHNRVRMVVASFLVKHLLLPWTEGARWFWDTLVDADLASNTQGWQWAAGCGADAAPYFRIFNPITQGEKFDKSGRYARQWIPELGDIPNKWLFRPWEAPPELLNEHAVELGVNYPNPCVDHSEARARALQALSSLKDS
jgi:deoxyribodipyrimidine photo-lyase